ncbi:hypothetical protein Tco_1012765, partial [Tanacetum coccineum]
GAVPGIVQVLKRGSMEARENAAATLFSLSVVDENKVTIGSLGAIPHLVLLLSEGTQRGKKDVATTLFNLCIYQGIPIVSTRSKDSYGKADAVRSSRGMGAHCRFATHGTDRGKRKRDGHLLGEITRYTEQQKLPHLHAETESNN